MAELSDQLLVVAIFAYLIAMICHAAEYAFGNRAAVGRGSIRPARELVAAGAGGSVPAPEPDGMTTGPDGMTTGPDGMTTGPDGTATEPVVDRGPGRAALMGRLAVSATALAAVAHLATIVTRGIAADRLPWGNMYEYVLVATFVAVVGWFVVLRGAPGVRHLGLFVAVAEVLLLAMAGLVVYVPIGPLVPALNSYWFVIHITAVSLASGLFLLGAVPAVMFLIRDGYEQGKRRFPYSLGRRVPAAAPLERMTFRLHTFAFPIWTFGVMAGAVWAEAAWGRYWGWDPKETWAFISWVVYAGYLHARATPSVKRSLATWIAVLGFVTMLINLFGVNLFISGLHSYAGVK
ncbi:c-type cytochrome biogenesis protein CcsB [Plantactinospora sp. KBS50]|uniref:c-type cytochrome biogenesis protein CcsB n=1 Tax=Plantactinospora sp. KBS50 TaxID=2024580 RepID=UPI000BAB1940|nr:c-type cytochrome biogenesis protein CcsB [Plantactinospora sp. KBS50]ASW53182.1 c-type cytochrome biogenesis protein CcsB [Plantactinospora sp. KBS50]